MIKVFNIYLIYTYIWERKRDHVLSKQKPEHNFELVFPLLQGFWEKIISLALQDLSPTESSYGQKNFIFLYIK